MNALENEYELMIDMTIFFLIFKDINQKSITCHKYIN